MELEDIRQGQNGDCFILSSLGSILSTLGEEFIKNITSVIKDENKTYIIFNYYVLENDNFIKKQNNTVYYNTSLIKISSKNKDWVKYIEYAYVKQFFTDFNKLFNEGGIAFNVLESLTGYKSKILINRLFDNKEGLYYEICNETIINNNWNNNFIKYLDIIYNKSFTIFIEKIWKILSKNKTVDNNKIYKLDFPSVIGITGVYNNLEIPGVINGHLYSIIGISKDKYNNKFLHVFNPHHNVKSRKTYYDKKTNNFISKTNIDRYGIWSFYEIVLFMSDLTYSFINNV